MHVEEKAIEGTMNAVPGSYEYAIQNARQEVRVLRQEIQKMEVRQQTEIMGKVADQVGEVALRLEKMVEEKLSAFWERVGGKVSDISTRKPVTPPYLEGQDNSVSVATKEKPTQQKATTEVTEEEVVHRPIGVDYLSRDLTKEQVRALPKDLKKERHRVFNIERCRIYNAKKRAERDRKKGVPFPDVPYG